jgi:hypothetical protein
MPAEVHRYTLLKSGCGDAQPPLPNKAPVAVNTLTSFQPSQTLPWFGGWSSSTFARLRTSITNGTGRKRSWLTGNTGVTGDQSGAHEAAIRSAERQVDALAPPRDNTCMAQSSTPRPPPWLLPLPPAVVAAGVLFCGSMTLHSWRKDVRLAFNAAFRTTRDNSRRNHPAETVSAV